MKAGDWMTILILGVNTVQDLRKREIFPMATLVAGTMGILWFLFYEKAGCFQVVTSMIPGILLLLTAVLTKEKVGLGDGLVLWTLGIWQGFQTAGICLLLGLFIACPVAWVKKTVPFVPCMTAAFLLVRFCL